MSKHSKWSKVKRIKEVLDVKKGAAFSKAVKGIQMAARQGGADPETNFRLRLAIEKAHEVNMPHDNIERAIKKASGAEGEGIALSEVLYEGYGSGGAAFLVSTITDNRTRTVGEIRHLFEEHGGHLAESGAVAYLFTHVGLLQFAIPKESSDTVTLMAIDAGAIDIEYEAGVLSVYTNPTALSAVASQLKTQGGLTPKSQELTYLAHNQITVDEATRTKIETLLSALSDHDDVDEVYTNVSFP
ncbi:MAG: YebC/PmpR family DNA-binding transcriptional regulator [Parcubacteria group bacterium]|nr:YebC/PmpR family DNA-binding transcriptional regulator [Parcubacteria group bacterium]